MNQWIRRVVCCLLSALPFSALAVLEPSGYTGAAIGVIGDFPEEHVERIRAFVESNTQIPVRILDPVEAFGESLGETLDAVADHRAEGDACVVFLYAGAGVFDEHTVYRYERKVGIVNVNVLRVEDEEQFLRRVEKLTIRSVGLLLDVQMVPNPHSAMWTYRTLEELDFMGRNYDPPSLIRFQENARALGIPLIERGPLLRRRVAE